MADETTKTLFREGDTVSMQGTVKYDAENSEDRVHIRVVGSSHTTVILDHDKVVLIARRWDSGEAVRTPDRQISGRVLAVHKDSVWLQVDGLGTCVTVRNTEIELNPDATKEETEQ